MQAATLVFLLKGNPVSEVLLGYKKTGFGQGKYTGFGGKIEDGEEIAEAALRELAEECGVVLHDSQNLKFVAVLEFCFPHQRSWEQRVFVFTTEQWQGFPTESDEMLPKWFRVDEIPYAQMWDDAAYWLPQVLSGEKFRARFVFNQDSTRVEKVTFKTF